MADVFVSYSRRDSAYVQRLVEALQSHGKDVWVDIEGIRDAEKFPAALRHAVEGSDAFVFVISPDSVHSDFCEQEVDRAIELNKRVVPLALRPVPDGEIPEEIRVRNWIPAGDDGGDFDGSVGRLLTALDTDLDWEHEHTRLTVKALEWDQAGRDRSFLLRGSELAIGEQWLAAGALKDLGPTTLEREYLAASRAAAARRQRTIVGVSLGIAAVSIALLVFALISRSQAISARNTAKSRALAAESQTQIAVDPERSILLGAAAVRETPTPEALFALRAALDASPIRFRLPDAGVQSCGGSLFVVPGAAFSPDGRQLAEGLCNGTVVLADAHTGRVTRRVHAGVHAGTVAYNRDGSLLAVSTGARTLLLDPATGAIRGNGPGTMGVAPLQFSPVGHELALGGPGRVTLWNTRTRHTRSYSTRAGNVPTVGLAFSADGRRLAITLPQGAPGQSGIRVLDVASGRTLATTRASADDVAFTPDGKGLVAAETFNSTGGKIAVLDPRTLAVRKTIEQLPSVEATAVAVSPDGTRVGLGGADGTAGLASLQTGQPIVSYLGQTAAISRMVFSPDGTLVATASQDGTLRVWRATPQESQATSVGATIDDFRPIAGGFVTLGQTPGGNGVAVQTWRGGRPAGPPLQLSPTSNVNADFLSRDGSLAGLIASVQSPAAPPLEPVRVWSVAGRRVAATVPRSSPPFGGEPVFSPDGKWIAMGKFVTSSSGGPIRPLPSGAPPPGALVHAERGPSMVLVNVRTGQNRPLGSAVCGGGWRSMPFSRDGSLVAGGTFCGQVFVWDVASGKQLGRSFSIGGELAKLAFSPDASRLAAASWNSTITVADVRTGRVVGVLTDHTRGVADVDYSPDGRYLASASLDGTVRIWDARSLRLLRILHHPDPADRVAFTPDSREVLTTDTSHVVREWDACTACGNAQALLQLAKTRVTRQLTPQERRTFGTG